MDWDGSNETTCAWGCSIMAITAQCNVDSFIWLDVLDLLGSMQIGAPFFHLQDRG